MKSNKKYTTYFDKWVFIVALVLLVFGTIMVVSAGSFVAEVGFHNKNFFIVHQTQNLVAAFVGFLIAMNLNYKHYKNKYVIGFLFVTAFAFLVFLLISSHGTAAKGAKRWLFGFQPSEYARFAIVYCFAFTLNLRQNVLRKYFKGYFVHLVSLGIVCGLVFLQPAFSTSMMIFAIGYGMFFISGMKLNHVVGTMVILVPLMFYVATMQDYRKDRIESFLHPQKDKAGKGWQVDQSLIALGNGGMMGVGVGKSRQKEFYLPEPYNDFIFAIIGDEIGFVGTIGLIVAYLILIWRGFIIAKNAIDYHGFILASGITLSIGIYAMFNMLINLGMVPPTGLPLPLISYGGTSLLFTLSSIGVLLNISYKSNIVKNNEIN